MKNVLRLLILAAAVASFTLPALAQDTQAGGAASPCTAEAEAKAALYQTFLASYKGTPEQQKAAYETGKQYISKYGGCPDENDKKVTTFIQNWVTKYEKAVVEFKCTDAINKTPAQAFQVCQEWLAITPDKLKVELQLVIAGLSGKPVYADGARAARQALDLVEQGKTTDNWAPYKNQQDAAMGLRYHIGFFTLAAAPEDAAANLLKVAQSDTTFGKEPTTFQYLGLAYLGGEFKKLAAEYKQYEGKDETPESKALLDKIYTVLDRIIDAYARAIALSKNNPNGAAIEAAVKPDLTNFYKQRHPEETSDAGLQALIANVLSKPIPIPGQEPVTTPAPASSSSTNGMNGVATPTGQPAAASTPAQPAANSAKPAATPMTNTQAKPASASSTPASSATPKPKP